MKTKAKFPIIGERWTVLSFDPFPSHLLVSFQLFAVLLVFDPDSFLYGVYPRVSFPLDPSFLFMARYARLLQHVSTAIESSSKTHSAVHQFNRFSSPGSSTSRK